MDFIVQQNLADAVAREVQERVQQSLGIYLSIHSGIITELKNQARAQIADATMAAASQVQHQALEAISSKVDLGVLVSRLGEMAEEYYNCFFDPLYKGPLPRPTSFKRADEILRTYHNITATILKLVPEAPVTEDVDPRYKEGHVRDVMAAIEEKDDVFYAPWLSKDHTRPGGVKRSGGEPATSSNTQKDSSTGD